MRQIASIQALGRGKVDDQIYSSECWNACPAAHPRTDVEKEHRFETKSFPRLMLTAPVVLPSPRSQRGGANVQHDVFFTIESEASIVMCDGRCVCSDESYVPSIW